MLSQPWLLVALGFYAANLAIAFFIQRPNLRRLVGVNAAADDRVWKERAKRQRYVSYVMAGHHRDDRVPDEHETDILVSDISTESHGGSCPAIACSAGSRPGRCRRRRSTKTTTSSRSATSRRGRRPTSSSSRAATSPPRWP